MDPTGGITRVMTADEWQRAWEEALHEWILERESIRTGKKK